LKSIEDKVVQLLEENICNLGYELYDVEYAKRGKDYYLTIFIDSVEGISLNDCEIVNNEINDLLDKEDLIKEQYYLEVSSPGLERILKKDKHLRGNIGKMVEINLYTKVDNVKKYEGILTNFTENEITIQIDECEKTFQRTNIAQIKTIYDWNQE